HTAFEAKLEELMEWFTGEVDRKIPPQDRRKPDTKEIYSESIFIDSGSHTIFNLHVKQGDYSYYNLSQGTEFRHYCDAYAQFIKKTTEAAVREGKEILFANVDAIYNPELTWKIQKFFEEEHEVCPVPVVHYGTVMEYV